MAGKRCGVAGERQLQPGQVVASRAGRDSGRLLVVLRVLDDRYVLVADGQVRTAERPKLKNVRHLQPCGPVVESVARKAAAGGRITDAELRRALRDIGPGGQGRAPGEMGEGNGGQGRN